MPPAGERLIEVGAGYGRLADEYRGYRHVVLLDSSDVHVAAAREKLGADPRFEIVLGDAAALPFPDASFDAVACVRVLHHFRDVAPIVSELARVVRPGGVVVVEYANKRNLKSIVRRLFGRQSWSPFAPGSIEYRPYHFDHSPIDVSRALRSSGFRVDAVRAVSIFRLPIARHLPKSLLVAAERRLQSSLGSITPAPSVFVRARRMAGGPGD